MTTFKTISISITLACFALLSTGCAQTTGDNGTTGALIGGVTGALAGSSIGKGSGRVAATMLGAFTGAVIGSEVGEYMDDLDRQNADLAFNQATKAPVGKTITWNNPQSGHYGKVTTIKDGRASSGEYCREFQSQVNIGGKVKDAYGTACMRPDGSWEIIS